MTLQKIAHMSPHLTASRGIENPPYPVSERKSKLRPDDGRVNSENRPTIGSIPIATLLIRFKDQDP